MNNIIFIKSLKYTFYILTFLINIVFSLFNYEVSFLNCLKAYVTNTLNFECTTVVKKPDLPILPKRPSFKELKIELEQNLIKNNTGNIESKSSRNHTSGKLKNCDNNKLDLDDQKKNRKNIGQDKNQKSCDIILEERFTTSSTRLFALSLHAVKKSRLKLKYFNLTDGEIIATDKHQNTFKLQINYNKNKYKDSGIQIYGFGSCLYNRNLKKISERVLSKIRDKQNT